jgi:hypothetical protein
MDLRNGDVILYKYFHIHHPLFYQLYFSTIIASNFSVFISNLPLNVGNTIYHNKLVPTISFIRAVKSKKTDWWSGLVWDSNGRVQKYFYCPQSIGEIGYFKSDMFSFICSSQLSFAHCFFQIGAYFIFNYSLTTSTLSKMS